MQCPSLLNDVIPCGRDIGVSCHVDSESNKLVGESLGEGLDIVACLADDDGVEFGCTGLQGSILRFPVRFLHLRQ